MELLWEIRWTPLESNLEHSLFVLEMKMDLLLAIHWVHVLILLEICWDFPFLSLVVCLVSW